MTILPAPELGREKETEKERERERERERVRDRGKYREKGKERDLNNWQARGRNHLSRERTSLIYIGEAQRQVGHMVHMQTIFQHNNLSYFLTVESAALLICFITCRLLHPTIQRKRDLLFKLLLTENTLACLTKSGARHTSLATSFKLIMFCGWLSSSISSSHWHWLFTIRSIFLARSCVCAGSSSHQYVVARLVVKTY